MPKRSPLIPPPAPFTSPTAQDDTLPEESQLPQAAHEDETPDGNVPVFAASASDSPAHLTAEAASPIQPEPAAAPNAAPPSDLSAQQLAGIEALLFSSRSPLTAGRLAELLGLPMTRPVKKGVSVLNEQYAASGRSFRIEQVAGGYQMLTLPEFGPLLQTLHHREADAKITRPALETLAIIAYKQPVLRTDIEAIRGVSCGETIRSLMEKHLVNIAGRAEIPGRPILYGTTKRFLEVFGLSSLKDLPKQDNPGATPTLSSPPAEQPEAAPSVMKARIEDMPS